MHKNIALAQAMNARLCHDLASSIGTIDNCLKLASHENKDIGLKAKNLALEEAENLVSKVKFFRGVYGLSDGEANMSLVNISKLLSDFLKSTKIKLNFHFEKGLIYIESPIAKIALCLTIFTCENIGNTGSVHLYIKNNEKNPITLLGKGKNILAQDEALEILKGTTEQLINVKTCRHHYIYELAMQTGYKILVSKNSDSIEYNLIRK
jgi:hypothetical protein